MKISTDGRISQIADDINDNKPILRNRITEETKFVNEFGYSGEMSKEAEKATKVYLECINEAKSEDYIVNMCNEARLQHKKEDSQVAYKEQHDGSAYSDLVQFDFE